MYLDMFCTQAECDLFLQLVECLPQAKVDILGGSLTEVQAVKLMFIGSPHACFVKQQHPAAVFHGLADQL